MTRLQLPKHLFYKNMSEWYSEVSILTKKDFREAERRSDELSNRRSDDSNRDHDDTLGVYIYIDCNYSRMSEHSCAKE
jgi:hypothetical protein